LTLEGYQPRPWETVEDGILYGPGYAVDIEPGDILSFVSPGYIRQHRLREDEALADTEEE
jgi:hypothetical protein